MYNVTDGVATVAKPERSHNAKGCSLLLREYTSLVVSSARDTLAAATALTSANPALMPRVQAVLATGVTGEALDVADEASGDKRFR